MTTHPKLSSKSARGLADSRTLTRDRELGQLRQVLECASPLALSDGSEANLPIQELDTINLAQAETTAEFASL